MPRSKRQTVVSLTKVKKKSRDAKPDLVRRIKEALHTFNYAYVVDVGHDNTAHLQSIRASISPDKLFLGKNRVMQVALGSGKENEPAKGVSGLGKMLSGRRGLLFTDKRPQTVETLLAKHDTDGYATSGFVATDTYALAAGAESLMGFSHSMEPELRKLGLPVELRDGVFALTQDTVVCTKGVPLTTEAAHLLRLLHIKMGKCRVRLIGSWDKFTEEVVPFEHESSRSTSFDSVQ